MANVKVELCRPHQVGHLLQTGRQQVIRTRTLHDFDDKKALFFLRRDVVYAAHVLVSSSSHTASISLMAYSAGASDSASYMARPQADADVGPKHRQRSNTTTFSSFTAGWRRPRVETVSTPAPQPQSQALAFDALVEALSPPAVPSLAHARALAAAIITQSPLPRASVLNPLLGSLCGVDSPPQLQCAGYEIMTSYWESYEGRVITSDRLAHCSLLLHTSWSPEIGDSRLRALRALTKGGSEAFGIEVPLLNLLKSWIDGAFDAYLSCDHSDRADRERSIELLAAFVSFILAHPETVARISEGDLASVLQFYASLVSKTLDLPLTFSIPDTAPVASPTGLSEQSAATKAASNGHKRHSSSVSVRSLPPSAVHPSRHPAELMTTIYLDHLHSQLRSLAPRILTLILPLLFRAQAFFASPLPRLSVMSGRPRGPVGLEERIQKMLHSLFSGPYGASCMMILKRHLSPTDQTLDSHSLSSSFGAHRTLRFDIRQALCSRMARAYIARLSTVTYTPSGAPSHMDLEKDLMERAWSKDDLSGWDLLKLGRMLCKSIEAWAKWASAGSDEVIRVDRDRILDEAAATLRDIFQEFDERDDGVDMDEEEASIAGETLRHLVSFVRPLKYVRSYCLVVGILIRMGRNPDDTPIIIPLSQPSDAPTPFLRTLTSLLARDHSTYMNPSLSTTLLSIADHLTDTDTAKLPAVMFEQHDLSPASPDWLRNWESILSNAIIFGPTRPLTRLEVMKALEAIYDSLKDMHSYRMDLAELVFKFCQREANDGLDTSANIVMGRILADEVVLRTVNRRTPSADNPSSTSPYTTTMEMIELLKKVASDSVVEDDDDTASINTLETPCPSPFAPFSGGIPNAASPVLSRRQSEYRNISVRDSGLPSVMSLLSTLAGSRSQSQHSQEQPDNLPPPLVSSPSPEPTFTRASLAVVSLVAIFSQLAFTPYSLTQENVNFTLSIFLTIVQMVTDAKCPRARVLALQFLMRIRADRDHRVYFVEVHHDSDGHTANLASLVGRGPESAHQDERGQFADPPQEEPFLRRSKGVQERDGRRSSRGRGVKLSQSAPSRSRSRAPLPISPPQPAPISMKSKDAIWSVPETLPFIAIDADTPSEGIVSYDPAQESPRVIPIDAYLLGVLEILEKERNWEILSYVLCHLPVQLSNKHLFCGPKCRVLIARLLTVICSGVTIGDLGSSIERWPVGLKARDAHGLAYHTLSVLISYRRCFEVPLRHALVDVLREGLNGQPSTIICCLHALTLSAFELTSSVKRGLLPLLEKLSQIMSNPDMAVHILSFLSVVGSIPELHANLREDDFKMVFGVALQYLQHHNRPGTTPVISWAMSQYVRTISFFVVYLWFLAVRLPDRPRHIPYITRQLLLVNEERSEVDEPTEVCFDWLARYTYASADPRPANSVLNEIIMNPTIANHSSSEPAISENHG
ncbi:tuberin-domain-containing protein [Lanmaoa asiatica]|nr:tuberin-domain-containing protein [Lanmaoa asiatica]